MPGAVVVQTVQTLVSAMLRLLERAHPAKLALLGYLSYSLIGWLLLCIPWVHKAGVQVSVLDNLFIATSAMSTTGLVTVSVSDSYNLAGQVIVLLLIQLGGIGYMTFGSFVVLSTKGTLTQARTLVGKTVFSLPESFRVDKFIRSVIFFTLLIESAGAFALYPILESAGDTSPAWSAIFHSVSAFCTAGFGLYNNSFENFAAHFWLNAVLSVLSFLGAVGFIVLVDYWRWLTGKVQRITLTSKIIISMTVWMIALGTLLVLFVEPSLRDRPPEERLLTAFFQAITAMTTAGFNTVPIGTLSKATLLILLLLMFIGASPSGTGGGVKSTTISALLGVMRSALRGSQEITFWKHPVPIPRVLTAIAAIGFYSVMLLFGTFLLELTQSFAFEQNLFEAASALGTVGLSTGITASLSPLGKLVVIFLMLTGRMGPITFSMALFFESPEDTETSDGDLAV